jgi:hypothetical protein
MDRETGSVKHRKSEEPGDRKNDRENEEHFLTPSFSGLSLAAAAAHMIPSVSSWFFGIDPGRARRSAGLGSPSLMEDRLSFIEALRREFWFRRVLPPVPIGRLVIVKSSTCLVIRASLVDVLPVLFFDSRIRGFAGSMTRSAPEYRTGHSSHQGTDRTSYDGPDRGSCGRAPSRPNTGANRMRAWLACNRVGVCPRDAFNFLCVGIHTVFHERLQGRMRKIGAA